MSSTENAPGRPKPTCRTPKYVLHENRQPIGAKSSLGSPGRDCLAMYGFSDKLAFDTFIAGSQRDLRPYPLMKSYLKRILDEEPGKTHLLIIDAADPEDAIVESATLEAVLLARQEGRLYLSIEFHLAFSPATRTYELVE